MFKKNILITAGPTREWMDPVRFLSNPSSGAMGIALANQMSLVGHRVVLILGPTLLRPLRQVKVVLVETGLEMESAVQKFLPQCDAFVSSAAVGDWRFQKMSRAKLKKNIAQTMVVKLVKNPDILAGAGDFRKKMGTMRPLLVGFALESNHLKRNALEKLKKKNLDLIVANTPASFSNEKIKPFLIDRAGNIKKFPRMTKVKLAKVLVHWMEMKWKQKI